MFIFLKSLRVLRRGGLVFFCFLSHIFTFRERLRFTPAAVAEPSRGCGLAALWRFFLVVLRNTLLACNFSDFCVTFNAERLYF